MGQTTLRQMTALALMCVAGTSTALTLRVGGTRNVTYLPGSPLNYVHTATTSNTASFEFPTSLLPTGGTIASLGALANSGDIGVVIRSSSHPNAWAATRARIPEIGHFFTRNQTTGGTSLEYSVPLWGGLPRANIGAGATFTIELADFEDDSTAVSATVTGLEFDLRTDDNYSNSVAAAVLTVPATMTSKGPQGNPNNSVATSTNPASSAIMVRTFWIGNGTEISNSLVNGDQCSDLRLGVSHSAIPGARWDVRPIEYDTHLLPNYKFVKNDFVDDAGYDSYGIMMVPVGGIYSIEAFEEIDNRTNQTLAENTVTNLSLGIGITEAYTQSHFALVSNAPSIDAAGDPDNPLVNLGTVTSSFVMSEKTWVNQGTATLVNSNSSLSECRIRIRNSAYPYAYYDIQPYFGGTGSTTASTPIASFITFTSQTRYFNQTMVGLPIPAGSSFSAEFYETQQNGAGGNAEAIFNTIRFYFLNTTASFTPTTFTGTSTWLGQINASTAPTSLPMTASVGSMNPTVRWFHFQVPRALDSTYFLDMTVTSSLAGWDPSIAIFSSTGEYILGNQDYNGDYPAISMGGPSTANRTMGTFTGLKGQNAPGLPAGIYYAAIFNSLEDTYNFSGNGFYVDNYSSGPNYTHTLRLATNVPPQSTTVNGLVTLTGLWNNSALNGDTLVVQVLDMNGNQLYQFLPALNSSNNYSVTIPETFGRQVVIRAFTRTSLVKQTAPLTLNGGTLSRNFFLTNGNTDAFSGDNEIGPGDLQLILDNFGESSGFPIAADLDQDGEVGPGDLQIVLDNFGLEGD